LGYGNAELPRLFGNVVLNPCSGENDEPDRQQVEHLVVALERRRLGVLGPVGIEGHLGNYFAMSANGAQLPPENAFVAAAIWGSADPLERSARDASTPSGHWIFH